MKHAPRSAFPLARLVAVGLFTFVAACGDGSPSHVVITVANDSGTPRPSHVWLDWVGPDGAVRSHRVPREGDLAADLNPLGTVRIELTGDAMASRKVRARGMTTAGQISVAAARVLRMGAGEQRLTLTLRRELTDSDGDGWPDLIDDDCPSPGCVRPDGGLLADGGDDAGSTAEGGATPDATLLDGLPASDAPPSVTDAPTADATPDTAVTPDGPSPIELRRGLLLYWPLDEASQSNNTANDSSGNNIHGTYSGSNTSTPDPSMEIPAPIKGFSTRSLQFNRTARDHVRVALMAPALRPAAVTLSAWYRTTAIDEAASDLISGGDSYVLRLLPAGPAVVKRTGGKWEYCRSTSAVHLDGKWHHLLGVITATELSVHLDGVEVCRMAIPGAITYDAGEVFMLGRNGWGAEEFDFGGTVDDVRVYGRALTPAEISALASGSQ